MKKYLTVLAVIFLALSVKAQNGAASGDAALVEMAQATLKAHGGEKLTQSKTLILRGSVEVTAPGSTMTLPATFAIVLSGPKYRFDIQSGFFNFLQVSDGEVTSSSMPGVSLPPINQVGLYILPKLGEPGYTVSALPEKLKKKKGFRMTSPEGFFSDFVIDEKTFQVKEYESAYEYNGRTISTSVAIEKYKQVDGVLVSEKFSQRLDLGQATAYANFNAKDILVNSEVSDDVFVIR